MACLGDLCMLGYGPGLHGSYTASVDPIGVRGDRGHLPPLLQFLLSFKSQAGSRYHRCQPAAGWRRKGAGIDEKLKEEGGEKDGGIYGQDPRAWMTW